MFSMKETEESYRCNLAIDPIGSNTDLPFLLFISVNDQATSLVVRCFDVIYQTRGRVFHQISKHQEVVEKMTHS